MNVPQLAAHRTRKWLRGQNESNYISFASNPEFRCPLGQSASSNSKVQNMNPGVRKQGIIEKLRRISVLMLVAGWPLVVSATAIAQDMSFDLDEAEAETSDGSAEVDEGSETEGEAEDEGGGDIFAELTADDGEDVTGEAVDEPEQLETAEEIYAVQRMFVLRNGRVEIAPSLAFSVNDPYTSRTALSGALNYWVTNVLAVGANVLWYQGLESESEINFSVRKSARLAVPITEYQLAAHLNFTYVPVYGKFTMFNDAIFQWDSYIVGGVGVIRTRPIAVVDSAVRKFDFDWRLSFDVGIGLRVFLTKWLTVFGELRDYIYLEKLENLKVQLGQGANGRNDPATWLDESATPTHNFAVQVGMSMFFPFTFDYREPK